MHVTPVPASYSQSTDHPNTQFSGKFKRCWDKSNGLSYRASFCNNTNTISNLKMEPTFKNSLGERMLSERMQLGQN